jgi:hypothetical protein
MMGLQNTKYDPLKKTLMKPLQTMLLSSIVALLYCNYKQISNSENKVNKEFFFLGK